MYNIEVTKQGYFTNTFNQVNYTSNDSEINIAICKCESGNICGEYFNEGNEILPAGDNISSCDNDVLNLGDYPIIGAKIGAKVGAKVGINVGALCGDDLVVSGMTATPANPFVGGTVIINATVNLLKGNIISNLDNVNVSLFIDSIYENSKIINLTNIGKINVIFNWTAVSGEHNISVVVDANTLIDEINESNNNKSFQVH